MKEGPKSDAESIKDETPGKDKTDLIEYSLETKRTWRLIDSLHCLLSIVDQKEQVYLERRLTRELMQTMARACTIIYTLQRLIIVGTNNQKGAVKYYPKE